MRIPLFKKGKLLDKYKDQLQFAFSISEQLLSSYKGNIIEVLEDDGGTTKEFKPSKTIGNEILDFVGANDGYIVGIYDQKTGIKNVIATSSQQIKIVDAGTLVNLTAKYSLEIPQYTTLTVSGIASCNRMKNLSSKNYIGFKGAKSVVGYTNDYVFPVNCGAGLMDFYVGGTNFWYDADGNTNTSNRPGVTLVNAGVSYAFNLDMLTHEIIDYGTNANFIGSLKDLPKTTTSLNLEDCTNVTGQTQDYPKVTNTLYVNNNSLVTGDISNLPKATTSIYCQNLPLVTGDLANVVPVSVLCRFDGCTNVTGIYTPGAGCQYVLVSGTNMSANDTDQTIINTNALGTSSGLLWHRNNRTSASDAAVTALLSRGWTVEAK